MATDFLAGRSELECCIVCREFTLLFAKTNPGQAFHTAGHRSAREDLAFSIGGGGYKTWVPIGVPHAMLGHRHMLPASREVMRSAAMEKFET